MKAIIRVDKKGRVLIPKNIREVMGIREKTLLRIEVIDGKIVLEPLRDIADSYYGIIDVKKWPQDLDEFLVKAIQEWWKRST